MEKSPLNSRLDEYLKRTNKSVLSVEMAIGTRGTIQNAINNNSTLGSRWLTKILEAYQDLNPEWLMTGKGSMLKSDVRGGSEISLDEVIRLVQENERELKNKDAFMSIVRRISLESNILDTILSDIKYLQKEVSKLKSGES